MNRPKVYVVILNYQNWQDTLECLESVLHSSYRYFSVIVIDNNSQNNSLGNLTNWAQNFQSDSKVTKESFSYRLLNKENINDFTDPALFNTLTFIQNDSNTGFAAGNNIALHFLQNEDAYIWLLNPDMIVREDTMTELIKFADKKDRHSIIGSVVKHYSGKNDLLFYGGGRILFSSGSIKWIKDPDDIASLDFISGGCLFTHACNFKRNGLLPEKYFLYWEETDWCYNARQKGCSLDVCTTAVCYDKVSTIIGKGFLANYYYTLNGLRFTSTIRKHKKVIILFFLGMRFLKRIITGKWASAKGLYKGARDFFKSIFYDGK
jgi:GT2 family glycosyltransferase